MYYAFESIPAAGVYTFTLTWANPAAVNTTAARLGLSVYHPEVASSTPFQLSLLKHSSGCVGGSPRATCVVMPLEAGTPLVLQVCVVVSERRALL